MLKLLDYRYPGNGEAYAASPSITLFHDWQTQKLTMLHKAGSGVKGKMTSNFLMQGRVNKHRWSAVYQTQSPLNLVFVFDALDKDGLREDIQRLFKLPTRTNDTAIIYRPEILIHFSHRALPRNVHEDFSR